MSILNNIFLSMEAEKNAVDMDIQDVANSLTDLKLMGEQLESVFNDALLESESISLEDEVKYKVIEPSCNQITSYENI